MKTLLRLTLLLVAWLALANGHAWAAPTVGAITNTANPVRRNNVLTVITDLSTTSGTATGYRFTSLPTASQGTLYIANAAINAYVVAAVNTTYSPAQAQNIAFQASTTATLTNTTFTFQAGDASGFSGNGTYTIPVNAALPTALNQAAPILPRSSPSTSIKPLESVVDASRTPNGFQILTLPTAGTLSVNGTPLTATTTLPYTVSTANASLLRYAPNASAAAGTYSFTYRAVDNTNAVGAGANYSLPVSNSSCTQNSPIDFSERTIDESWKQQNGVKVVNTTVSTRGYTSSVPAGQTNILQISDQPARLSTKGLVWQLDNENVSEENISTVQMDFSRPVRNLAFAMEDIDISTLANGGSDFIDEVTFNAYRVDGTLYQLQAADVALGSNNSNTFVAGTNTIKGTAANSGPAGTVVLTFPSTVAVSRLEIVYRNTQTYTPGNLRLQTVGIPSMVWCSELDVETTLTGSTRVQAGQTVTYVATTTNQGDLSAATVNGSVQLAQNLSGVTVNGATTGFTYTASTGLLTYSIGTLAVGATDTRTIRFTMPTAGSVTGKASSTTGGVDIEANNNNGTLANANVTTIQNRPPVAQNVVAPSMLNTNSATAIPALVATDPDGNNTITSYLLTNIPAATAGTLSYTRNGATITLAAGNASTLALRTLTPAEMATLTFDPVATFSGNTTFNFSASDDFTIASNTATYTIPVFTTLSGTIFDDVNYGGGAGRTYAVANADAVASGFATGAIRQAGATVELYDANGAFVATTTTNAQGQYTFNVAAATYTVRVVNSTVNSVRTLNTGFTTDNTQAVQTFVNGATNRVGGEAPEKQDAAANTNSLALSALTTGTGSTGFTPQSITSVVVPAVGTTGIDFGFNFDLVVNTNNSGQGSLRQFVTNSNALSNTGLDQDAFNGTPAANTTAIDPAAGTEYAIFMLNDGRTSGTALPGLRLNMTAPTGYSSTTKAFTFNVGAPFNITDSNTAIDGKVQTQLTGEGTTPTATALAGEIILDLTASNRGGLFITGGNTRIASLNILNAGVNSTSRALNTTGAAVQDGVAIVLSGASTSGSVVTDVTGQNNTIATVLLENGATGVTLSNNSFRTGRSVPAGTSTIAYDGAGILLSNASGNTISSNNISNNNGFGIELISSSNNTISNNTLNSNGAGAATTDDAGISITSGNNNRISTNTITNSSNDGIVVMSGTSGNLFTRNSFSGNGDLGIDLSATTAATGDGMSRNGNSKTTASGANSLLNFPVITQAVITNTSTGNLQITGYAPAGSTIELFIADKTVAGFGQGKTFLTSMVEGGTTGIVDGDAKVGNYSGTINGFDQGSETGAPRFFFTIPLSSLSQEQRDALVSTTTPARLTATATVSGSTTSEFSSNILVTRNAPLPVTLVSFTAQGAGQDTKLIWRTAQELNNDRFVVERSFDAASFQAIGEVKGQGTTTVAHDYNFLDAKVGQKVQGTVYYRLRQVDTDGTVSLSAVQAVTFAKAATASVEVYPNPASDLSDTRLDLSGLPQGAYRVSVTDMAGRVVRSLSLQGGLNQQLDVKGLPQGSYLITIQGNSQLFTKRLVKE